MKTKNYFSFGIILLSFFSHCTEKLDTFYSTSFLKNHSAVRESLKEHGFKSVTFKTPDNLTLRGLFLSRPNATCNVIVCAGWRPGRKEGMATFYALLPTYCNILLFDARGHGESDGPLLWNLWRYGIDEHKDITAAICWTNKNNTLPIIISGACSGAFNAAHALIHLEKNNTLTQSHVKGLIFDSGWGSIIDVSNTVALANTEEIIVMILKYFYKTKKLLKQSHFYTLSTQYTHCICKLVHSLFTKQLVKKYEPITSLFNKIHHLKTPIFFIHSYDDRHADIHKFIRLSKLTQNKECWWIQDSYHTQHNLIHRELYKEKLSAFIDAAIQQ